MSGLSPSEYPEYAQFIANKKGSTVGYGTKPALLLIDVCKAYFTPGPLDISSYSNAASAPDSMKRLMAAAHAGGCPVIWAKTNYIHPKIRDAGLLAIKNPSLDVFRDGDSRGLNEFLEGFEPDDNEIIIHKKCPSAFFGTNLLTQLHVLWVDTLIIGGFCTSGSVRATALDSMQSGLRTMVVASACGDKSRETHFSNLFDINAKYGDVVSEQESIENLKAGR
ncbi:putative N-carbamoylsarcosine amidase [Mollisia scopiformis]|uniref:Putative N-carbamoylsarcosine amidase n=1 Tax=Mollisia scopiformis TaxID=149040 RepID=A0A132BDD7_MOLSC|nr:putative N-carbamoylsarcosine amidase [Mollisia scopiformis]KUJ10416.1 putative N-carbamoylsarcosine amidase [Mollisia scopiformis]